MFEGLLKKYFFLLQLIGIAALAAIVAAGINDWVGGRLFAVPTLADHSAADAAALHERGAWGRVARDEDAAEVLSARHVFDLDPEPDTPPPAPPPEPAPAPVAEDDGELDESELAIDLVGTLVMEEEASSMATLEIGGRNRIGWTGSELLGGKAKIVKIAQRHVILEEDGELTVVRLWGDDEPAPPRPRTVSGRGMRARTKAMSPSQARTAMDERLARSRRLRQAIKRAGPYSYTVDRRTLEAELKDVSQLQSEARSVPSYEDSRYRGIKLIGVRPGSLYRALGIRSGDVLTAVNGRSIDSPTRALDLFGALGNASDVKLEIERRGQTKTLSYAIQ